MRMLCGTILAVAAATADLRFSFPGRVHTLLVFPPTACAPSANLSSKLGNKGTPQNGRVAGGRGSGVGGACLTLSHKM